MCVDFFSSNVLATLFGYRFCGGSTWRDNYNVNKWVFVMALSLVPAKLTAVYRKNPSTYREREESVLCLVASTWKRVLLERKRQFNAQVTKASERCDYISSFIRFAEWTEKHTHTHSSHPIAECAREYALENSKRFHSPHDALSLLTKWHSRLQCALYSKSRFTWEWKRGKSEASAMKQPARKYC